MESRQCCGLVLLMLPKHVPHAAQRTLSGDDMSMHRCGSPPLACQTFPAQPARAKMCKRHGHTRAVTAHPLRR